jgi:hypothetical protein
MNLAQAVALERIASVRPQFAQYVAPLAELLERGLARVIVHEMPIHRGVGHPYKLAGIVDPRLAGGVVLLCALGGLTIWALLERSGRLDCAVHLAEYKAAYAQLAGAAQRQSAAVADLDARGAQARAAGRQAAIAAAAEAKLRQDEIDTWKRLAAMEAPAGASCREALERIRGAL